MAFSRRDLFERVASFSALAPLEVATAAAVQLPAIALPSFLPDRLNFHIDHPFLNAAYAHPMGTMTYRAIDTFMRRRVTEVDTPWPADNSRDTAVKGFARLINAEPKDLAVVPSTMEGENLIVRALGLNANAGVVTDAYHYSPQIYGELRNQGTPVSVALPRGGRIDLADIDRLIDRKTRLVAVSAVSSDTGFRHDLKALCELAHRKGALVYADIIQAAGAVPIDVQDVGVDFCACGGYKWLMGDFGVAFLYVRPDRLAELQRVFTGWRQYEQYTSRLYPFDPQGPAGVAYTLRTDTVGVFEVSTPNWSALAGLTASLTYLQGVGVDRIAAHRRPMMARLQAEAPKYGYIPLTPTDLDTPAIAFALEGAAAKLAPPLGAARIKIQLSRNRLRISPSVYNDMTDIDRLLQVMKAAV